MADHAHPEILMSAALGRSSWARSSRHLLPTDCEMRCQRHPAAEQPPGGVRPCTRMSRQTTPPDPPTKNRPRSRSDSAPRRHTPAGVSRLHAVSPLERSPSSWRYTHHPSRASRSPPDTPERLSCNVRGVRQPPSAWHREPGRGRELPFAPGGVSATAAFAAQFRRGVRAGQRCRFRRSGGRPSATRIDASMIRR